MYSLSLSLLALILTCAKLQSDQIILDNVMSKEEQRKTGVAKLSFKQKIELESWLNKTFVLKEKSPGTTAPLSLSINIDRGAKLQLSDNSIWLIAPTDRQISSIWLTPFPVKIIPSGDPDYPFRIINLDTEESVRAKKESS